MKTIKKKFANIKDKIAKEHKVDKAVVEKHYKKMLEEIKDEVSK